jgi:hypothetical protein
VYFSTTEKAEQDQAASREAQLQTVRGLIGSEKEAFLSDPRVLEVLRRHGLEIQVVKAGSREIAGRSDLKSFDFAYPAGAPAAVKIQQVTGAHSSIPTFHTVMAVASWEVLVPVLEKNGIVSRRDGIYYIIDMRRLLELVQQGKRWRDLEENAVFAVGKSILVTSTDLRKSNSAAMYASLASYIANGDNVIQSGEDVQRVLPIVLPLFLKQGFQESSSAGPWEDYVSMRMGKSPLVMIYEAQYLEYQAKRVKPDAEMALLYPVPTVITKHMLVPFNEKGQRLGELLASDPQIQKVAAEYGLRGPDPAHFSSFMKAKGVAAPASVTDVIDPPAYEWLEALIDAVEQRFQ